MHRKPCAREDVVQSRSERAHRWFDLHAGRGAASSLSLSSRRRPRHRARLQGYCVHAVPSTARECSGSGATYAVPASEWVSSWRGLHGPGERVDGAAIWRPHRLISRDLDADAATHRENFMSAAAARLPDGGEPEK